MKPKLSDLTDASAVALALEEFGCLGRDDFLARHGFGKSRDYLVQKPRTTTTIRIDDELKTRVAAAAERTGKTAHAFILDEIVQAVQVLASSPLIGRLARGGKRDWS